MLRHEMAPDPGEVGWSLSATRCMQATKDIPAVKAMLREAQQVLGYDLLPLCTDGPKEKLDDTAYAQVRPCTQGHPRSTKWLIGSATHHVLISAAGCSRLHASCCAAHQSHHEWDRSDEHEESEKTVTKLTSKS